MMAENCQFCHGAYAISSGVIPDLRWSAISASEDSWAAVVRDGALTANGMVGFSDIIDDDEKDGNMIPNKKRRRRGANQIQRTVGTQSNYRRIENGERYEWVIGDE